MHYTTGLCQNLGAGQARKAGAYYGYYVCSLAGHGGCGTHGWLSCAG
ncbi:hypothetical protein EBME_0488 [bacterium endosymbiont of Mortierella elongata FMR23-6]|nr:hypothetical protein EBME_0488 [bacterium endosymbiont of Mortierella elongata FMR23-6]